VLSASNLLFWQSAVDSSGYTYYTPTVIAPSRIFATPGDLPSAVIGNWANGDVAFVISSKTFYQYRVNPANGTVTPTDVSASWRYRVGRNNISFQWKHYAPYDQRIDPAIMNMIDVYVLTKAYDTNLRNWIAANGTNIIKPTAPNTNELASTFANLEVYKMMTDQLVWHPVQYKLLFGQQADPQYRGKFVVVKSVGTTVSNNEIQSLVINSINSYFALANWDFGQSFFFTELAAYIHLQLATVIGSIVFVPLSGSSQFGDLFEITANPDEILISSARVTDVQIVTALTDSVLGITNG
jgi:hypothetical protein